MKTILVASALAGLFAISGTAVEIVAGHSAHAAQRSCVAICANAAQASPQELCVARCKALRERNAKKARSTR